MANALTLASLLYELGQWAGFIGLVSLTLLIVSGDTARWWDRYFGLDKIIKFQRKFSLFTAVFILLHPIFFITSGRLPLGYLIPDLALWPLALGIFAFYLLVVILIASQIYKMISYATWQYLHVLTYLLFFFSWYHALNWGSDSELLYIELLYGLLLLILIIGLIYRTNYKIKKLRAGKFFVQEIKPETADTFTLILKPEKPFYFQAGQFCFLRLNKNRLHARHPFTIASAPDETNLHFTIKQSGAFTKTASELKVGEEVLLDGPFGVFTKKDPKKPAVFIAGGVGITPFMSLLRDQIAKHETTPITLLYASKDEQNIIFKNELDAINQAWLKKIYILSQTQTPNNNCEMGRLNQDLIKKYVSDLANSEFYICGPAGMKNEVKNCLKQLGVRKQSIFVEDFFW